MVVVLLNDKPGFDVDVMKWEEFRDALKIDEQEVLERVCSYDCVIGLNELQCDMGQVILLPLPTSLLIQLIQ